jgi:hypothetical protein
MFVKLKIKQLLLIFFLTVSCTQLFTLGGELISDPLEIKGAKVSTQTAAKRLAFTEYVKKMRIEVLATERARDVVIIKLGYSIPGFIKKNEKFWEVRVLTLEDELRAIIWVNAMTEKVRFVAGPWDEEGEKNEKK